MSEASRPAPPNVNALWAGALMEELARAGVREVCLAPGSRSTALVFAAWAQEGLKTRVFLDERSAAFFALGVGKATGVPAAVITTSGTAVANLLPAAVEAHQSEAPLLLVTADRPHHLRDADANQAIRQPGIFGAYVREAWDLPQPRVDDQALRHLRAVAVRGVAAAVGDPPGAVHLNVPFRKPLEPALVEGDVPGEFLEDYPVAARGRAGDGASAPGGDVAPADRGRPLVEVRPRRVTPDPEGLEALAEALSEAERPVLVMGATPRPDEAGQAALKLAAAGGIPILPDPLSRARTLPSRGSTRITAYDLALRNPLVRERLAPDLVLRVGAAPTSAALLRYLDEHAAATQWVVDGGVRWKDHLNVAEHYLPGDPAAALSALVTRIDLRAPASWRDLWESVDESALTGALDAPGPLHEGHLARAVVKATPGSAALFVSSSMPIRDVDAFGGARDDGLPVFGNRGASGIDGIVSTAAGVSAGSGRPVVALVGDLAFLHDSNGLLALREEDVEVQLVVVNNDGGGIFHMLPVREMDPPFTEFFATPHGLELRHLAELHGLAYERFVGVEEALPEMEAFLSSEGSRVMEIRTERDGNRIGHEAAVAAAQAAARDALENAERQA